jgi:hypothetical protein
MKNNQNLHGKRAITRRVTEKVKREKTSGTAKTRALIELICIVRPNDGREKESAETGSCIRPYTRYRWLHSLRSQQIVRIEQEQKAGIIQDSGD